MLLAALALPLASCVKPAPADPAVIRETPPPWSAPRDAISYIDFAGLGRLPLDATDDPHVLTLTVVVDGRPVEVPAYIGVDRLRALQAPCHTHDTSGTVWLEGTGGKDVTLGQLFDLWGVRLTSTCLGATCGRVVVTVDGTPVASPRDVRLRDATSVRVEASPGS